MKLLRRWVTKVLCKWRKHSKVITFWTRDFAYDETSEWIRCECGERVSFVRYRGGLND